MGKARAHRGAHPPEGKRPRGAHVVSGMGHFEPEALTYFAAQTGEDKYAFAPQVLYPVPFSLTRFFHRPHLKKSIEAAIVEDTISVHFWGRRFRNIFFQSGGVPLDGYYADDLCKKHGVDPTLTANLFVLKSTPPSLNLRTGFRIIDMVQFFERVASAECFWLTSARQE